MLKLSAPQNIFLNVLRTKFRAFVGGYGSGKTYVGCLYLLIFFSKYPKTLQAYFAPTYPQIRDIFYPTFEEAAATFGFRCKFHLSNKEIHLYRGKAYYGTVICRSMSETESIVGFKVVNALVDEIDTLDKVKAKKAWDKIIARLRFVIAGVENSVAVTTTPEGFHFVYDTFASAPSAMYSMVQSTTYENQAYLPPNYIDSMLETYSEELVTAYIHGRFINLTAGSVYSNYNRIKNRSNATENGVEALHIGLDFNVGQMSAIVHVERAGQPIAVDEMVGLLDTPTTIAAIAARYCQTNPNRLINIYPDASGGSRKSVNAGETDISMLQAAGFNVYNDAANPAVRDRVNAMQACFLSNKQERFYTVNDSKCPNYANNLEQQAYDKFGKPEKKGNDHTNDAGGYYIMHRFPLIRPVTKFNVRF